MKIKSLLASASAVLLFGTLSISHASAFPPLPYLVVNGKIDNQVPVTFTLSKGFVENVAPGSENPFPIKLATGILSWSATEDSDFIGHPVVGEYVYVAQDDDGTYANDTCKVDFTVLPDGQFLVLKATAEVGATATEKLSCDITADPGNPEVGLTIRDGGSVKS